MRTPLAVLSGLVFSTLLGCGGAGEDPAAASRSAIASPAPGSPDTSFGTNGKVLTTSVEVDGPVLDVLVQPDGKIVVVTTFADGVVAGTVFGLVRYLPGGAIDASFGAGGVVRTAITQGFNTALGVASVPGGGLIVVGAASTTDNATEGFGLARYDANGALVASFGKGGVATTSLLGFRDDATAVLVQPDGKLLVGGSALPCFGRRCTTNTALVRYRPDGSLDATFGAGGKVVVPGVGDVTAMALETDGSVLVAGPFGTSVARFDATGQSVPVAVAGGTLAQVAIGGDVTFQRDGRVVVGSTAKGLGKHGSDVQVRRFTTAGAADPTWQSPPFAFAARFVNSVSTARTVLVEANGDVLVGGSGPLTTNATNFADGFGLARLAPGGALDAAFGSGGKVTTEFSDQDAVDSLAVQPDGKIVAAGISGFTDSTGTLAYGIALARYNP